MPRPILAQSDLQPNLTPILDMVFQLITFFMLVLSFQAASMDRNLRLPVVGSSKPVDTNGSQDVLVLNIDVNGNLSVYGEQRDLESYIAGEAQASRLAARRNHPTDTEQDALRTDVVIRADRDIPFSLLNKVLLVCQRNGFRKFSLKALNKS